MKRLRLVKDADIFSASGEKIGTLDRVVLDPETKKVSYLVIRKGFLLTTDKVIPMDLFNLEGERITLSRDAKDFDFYPDYNDSEFIGIVQKEFPEQTIESVYWYPPVSAWDPRTLMKYPQPARMYVRRRNNVIPENSVALDDGATVVSSDNEEIGNIERIILDPKEERATHIVVGSGLLTKEYRLVPTFWIKDATDEKVYLTIDSKFFEKLPEYELVS